jgi:hypothetical protein
MLGTEPTPWRPQRIYVSEAVRDVDLLLIFNSVYQMCVSLRAID